MAWTVDTPRDLVLSRALGLVGAVTDLTGAKRMVEAGAGQD